MPDPATPPPEAAERPWWAFWRKRDDGVTLPTTHHCKPPHAYEWPAGEWKLRKDLPIGSEWVCPTCSDRWRVGTRNSLGLWKGWEPTYGD